MRTWEAFREVEEFINGWNSENSYQNVLDIQGILCMADSQEKLRRLRRRHKSLILLKSDLIAQDLIENRCRKTREVFKSLEARTQEKIEVCSRAIEKLMDILVDRAMSTWLDDLLSQEADFSGAGYDGEAADFMRKG
jgi:hypothetical protein